jgi:DNA replication protein DnaC
MVQFLLMYMFQSEQVFSNTDVSNYTVKAADEMFNVERKNFFWTKFQFEIIEKAKNRVLLTSDFGTGKTILLVAMIKKLISQYNGKTIKEASNQGQMKIFFILFTAPGTKFSILD